MSEAQAETVREMRDPLETLRSGGSAKLAAEQLVGMLRNGLEDEIGARLDWLTERLDALAARLDGVLDQRESVGPAAGAPSDPDALREAVRGAIENLLAEEEGRELFANAAPAGGADADQIKRIAGGLMKDFLSENLTEIFDTEVRRVVAEEVEERLSSDGIKQLIDEKFRAVSLYLTSDVIPKAVRQALKDS